MARQKGLTAGAGAAGRGATFGAAGWGREDEAGGRLGLEKDREPRLPELLPPPARAKIGRASCRERVCQYV